MASPIASATLLVPPIAATIVTSMCLDQSDESLSERITSDNFILWSASTITIAAVAIAYFSNLPTIALGFAFLGLLTIYSLSGKSNNSELIEEINQLRLDAATLRNQAESIGRTNDTFKSAINELGTEQVHFAENIGTLSAYLTDLLRQVETMSEMGTELESVRNELRTSIDSLISQVERLETTHQNTSSSLRNVVLNQEASIVQNRRTQEMLQLLLQHLLPADDFPEPGRLAQVPVRIGIRDGVQVIYPLANPQPLHSGSSSPVSLHSGETIFGDDGSVVSSTAASAEALSLTGSNSAEQYIVIQGLPPAYQDVAELGTGRVPSQE